MDMLRMPSLSWSQKPMFKNVFVNLVMSRNRFELFLKFWDFSDNNLCSEGDRLFKIQPLVDLLIKKSEDAYTLVKIFCIDETLAPFWERLNMKQYIPLKTHKYGVKIFKLYFSGGYTWNMKLYGSKEAELGLSVSTKSVTFLGEKLLNAGRTIIMDNYYTSLELANILLDKIKFM